MTGQQTDQQSDQQSEQPRLELLPAVDIAERSGGAARAGRRRQRRSVRRPVGGRARRGRTREPSGSTSSTSTPPSAAAATASSSPRSSAGSTCRSSSPEASATPTPSRPRSPPAAAGSTSARRRSRTPTWTASIIAEHGDRVAIGLDVRGTTLAARGWTREGGDLWETLERLDREGCARYVVTDVNKDGMLQGPNVQLLRDVCARTDRPVVASGGVSTLEDIAVIRELVPRGGRGRHRRVGALSRCLHAARGPRRGGAARAVSEPYAHFDEHGRPADSVGQAWQGKSMPTHGFEGDVGGADPAVIVALDAARERPRPRRRGRAGGAGRRGPVARAGRGSRRPRSTSTVAWSPTRAATWRRSR